MKKQSQIYKMGMIAFIMLIAAFFLPCEAQSVYMPKSDLLLHTVYMTKERKGGGTQRFMDDKYIHINGCSKRIDMIFAATGEIYESFRYSSYTYHAPSSETGWAECWIFSVIKQHPQDDLQSVALFVDTRKREMQFMMGFSEGTVIYDIDAPQIKDCY